LLRNNSSVQSLTKPALKSKICTCGGREISSLLFDIK
jgi:hypothetical protein